MENDQKYIHLEDPSRNFNILGSTTILDPMDGREKIVLSNFAAKAIGNVILIDSETGEGESIQIPGDSGAWGILNLHNDKLLIGTCPEFGYLHSLDLKTRTWAEPLRDENENYFWGLTLGSDGMVYGGTSSGCALLRYNPNNHTLENMGRASDNSKNIYSRPVHGELPGYIIVSGGYDTPFLTAWNMETGKFKDFGSPGAVVKEITKQFICTAIDNFAWNNPRDINLQFYDPKTFELIDNPSLIDKLSVNEVMLEGNMRAKMLKLSNGKIAGLRGQEYFIMENDTPIYHRIPTPAPATHIHTITSDAHGNIWGASGFGQTIFSYNPNNKKLWNSPSVCNGAGEVYGMCFIGETLFMSCYAGGDHVVYNPQEPWNQHSNINPKTLESVYPKLIRPTGRSVLGPDGAIWSGWNAKYGTYGGGLSRIDASTLEVDSWYDPIPEQQVAGLTADKQYLYFTTNGGASGLPTKECVHHFCVWSPAGEMVYKQAYDLGQHVETVLAVGGKVFVGVDNEIHVFDPIAMEFVNIVKVEQRCTWMIEIEHGKVGAFCGNDLYFIDVNTGSFEHVTQLPGHVGAAATAPDGKIYFAQGTGLYQLTL